jgi:hypothetical protein
MTTNEYDSRFSALCDAFARKLMEDKTIALEEVPAKARALATKTLGERPTETK